MNSHVLKQLVDQFPGAVVVFVGEDLVFGYLNEECSEIWDHRDMLGRPLLEACPELGNQGFAELLLDVLRTGKPYRAKDVRTVLAQDESKVRYFDFTYSRILDEEGKPYGVLTHSADVTDRVLSRNEVIRTKNLLDDALRVGKLGHYEWNVKTGVEFSEHLQKLWGFSKGTYSLHECMSQILPQDLYRLSTDVFESLRAGQSLSCEFRFKHPETDEVFWVSTEGEVSFDESGSIVRFFGTAQDITPKKRVELKLKKTTFELEKAVEVAKVGFFDWDIVRGTVKVSQQMQITWGLEESTVSSEECYACIFPDDVAATRREIESSVREGRTMHCQYRIVRPSDGKLLWIDARGMLMSDHAGNQVRMFGTTMDITKQKMFEQDLLDARREAERANNAKSIFLTNMSHEIRTPLGAILGFTKLLKGDHQSEADGEKYLSVIEKNSTHLLQIVDDILDLSKVEAGKMVIERIEFSLLDLLRDLDSALGFRAKDKGISFELRVDGSIPDFILSDPTRIRQILINCVGNAIKFTDKGKVSLEVAFSDLSLQLRVSDSGCGISEENQKKLFKPFEQGDASTTRKFGGTGLGLILTRKIARSMGGDFSLTKSMPSKGSVFTAEIPVELSPRAEMVSGDLNAKNGLKAGEKSRPEALAGMNVLVVDDSADNQVLFRILLERAGAKVAMAKNGKEGVDRALSENYDVVLMDVQMPEMDGHEATRALRTQKYTTPIVALTAHAMKEERERAIDSGFNDFLTKPIQGETLIDVVAKYH